MQGPKWIMGYKVEPLKDGQPPERADVTHIKVILNRNPLLGRRQVSILSMCSSYGLSILTHFSLGDESDPRRNKCLRKAEK